MKLISTFIAKKTLAVTLLILMVSLTDVSASPTREFRVFWNRVEASITKDNTVILTWNVTEYNNKTFIVQHSVDGIKWEDIALVQSQDSHESMTDYSYTHKNKLTGKQYYRIKDIDIDVSSSSLSPVKILILKSDHPVVAVWPNPATDHILIENSGNNNYTKATIYNLTGKVMIESNLGAEVNNISINELSAGTYIVKIQNSKGDSQSQKIIKQ